MKEEPTMEITIGTVLILVGIGMFAGMLSGFIGVGGGVVIVPGLVYFLGLTQFQAQGTSLALMLPPIGILAFYNYYKAGNVNLVYAAIIAVTFIIGGYFGSKISLRLNPSKVKLLFGILMLYVAIRMVWKSIAELTTSHGT
jgi:uncharacterized membrane protein YfcA